MQLVSAIKKFSPQQSGRYLLFFILAVLPLERIPAVHPRLFGYEVTIRLSQIAGAALIALGLPYLWQKRREWFKSPWLWLGMFLLASLLSAGLGIAPLRGLLVTAFIAFDVLLAWLIVKQFRTDDIPRYQKIIIWAGVAACLIAVYQYVGDLAGLPRHATGLLARYQSKVFGFPRVQATAYEPLFFANYLLIPIGLAAAAFLKSGKSYRWPLLLFLAIVWMTLSRGAYLALAGLLVFLAILQWRQWQNLLRLALIVALSVALAIIAIGSAGQIKSLFNKKVVKPASSVRTFARHSTGITEGDSFYNRSVTWQTALQAFRQRPLLGVGPGTFGTFAYNQKPKYFRNRNSIVNNEPLELLAENGLAGLSLLGLFVIGLIQTARRKWPREAISQTFVLGMAAALVGITIQYLTFSTLYITHVWVAIGLMLGGLLAAKGKVA